MLRFRLVFVMFGALFPIAVPASGAALDCPHRIDALAAQAAKIADTARRERAEQALSHARHELEDENDQPECSYFADQAEAVLREGSGSGAHASPK